MTGAKGHPADEWVRARGNRGEKTSERIARSILQDIRRRGLRPGDSVGLENDLIQRFGVGKASVREALRILELNGLVSIKTGATGGPIVRMPGSADFAQVWLLHLQAAETTLRHLVEARVELEPLLAREAAAAATPADHDRIRQAAAASTASTTGSDEEYAAANRTFHDLVLAASGDPALAMIAEALRDICVARVAIAVIPRAERAGVAEAHTAIAGAITAGDGSSAERLMRDLMLDYRDSAATRYPALLDDAVEWD